VISSQAYMTTSTMTGVCRMQPFLSLLSVYSLPTLFSTSVGQWVTVKRMTITTRFLWSIVVRWCQMLNSIKFWVVTVQVSAVMQHHNSVL